MLCATTELRALGVKRDTSGWFAEGAEPSARNANRSLPASTSIMSLTRDRLPRTRMSLERRACSIAAADPASSPSIRSRSASTTQACAFSGSIATARSSPARA